MNISSYDKYCRYRSNQIRYDVVTAIPMMIICFAFIRLVLNVMVIVLLCVFLYNLIKAFSAAKNPR